MENNLLYLGHGHHPHGLKGAMILQLMSGKDTILRKGHSLHLFPFNDKSNLPTEGRVYKLQALSLRGNKIIAELEGISDRTSLESLLPFRIYMEKKDLPELKNDEEYYLFELIGLDVFAGPNNENQQNQQLEQELGKVGVIDHFYENGAQTILVIKPTDPQEEFLELPFVEAFFPQIDLMKGRVVINRPQYL